MTEAASDEALRPDATPRPKRRRWLRGLRDMTIAMLVLCLFFLGRPLCISTETTRITEPLKSNGREVDYFAAIRNAVRPDGAATDQNGFRLIARHLGGPPEGDPAHFACVCRELGLDAGKIQPDVTYAAPYDALKAYVESEQFDETFLDQLPPDERTARDTIDYLCDKLDRPWTLDELPMMAEWLERNSPALDLVGRAVRMPAFHIPLVRASEDDSLIEMDRKESRQMRSLTRGLIARAHHRIAMGDLDGALDDRIACQRLGRHLTGGPSSTEFWCGLACEQMGLAVGIAGSPAHPPTKEQVRRLVAETDGLPPEADLSRAVMYERFSGLDGIQSVASGRWGEPKEGRGAAGRLANRLLWSHALDWNVVARRYNEHFDAFLATGEGLPTAESGLWTRLSVMTVRGRSNLMADLLSRLMPTVGSAIQEASRRAACSRRMSRITLAMLLYESDHGSLPPAFTVDAEGRPLHGWRVLLLPYLGEQALYERLRLDEPWDSEHNRQFHGADLPVYRCPDVAAAGPGQTTYTVLVGSDAPFEAGQAKKLAGFKLNADDTILVAERADPVGWMDPTGDISQAAAEEWLGRFAVLAAQDAADQGAADQNPAEPPADARRAAEPLADGPGLGNPHARCLHFGVCSGAVRMVDAECDAEALLALRPRARPSPLH
ncbi:MAG: DUF1559 domain-containing protein [Patescibacteria group bacterium]|nr:DUF1559 domain-containing protein [Patescibacteria group bacterium]